MTRWMWLTLAMAAGCQTQDPADDQDTSAEDSSAEDDECACQNLGEDFAINPDVPNGDPEAWASFPPDAIVSTTCLRKVRTDEIQALFDETKNPVVGEIASGGAPGIMGMSVGNSIACNVSRTLTVWESEEALLTFVTGPAHGAAIPKMGEISRGGSINSRWKVSDLDAVDWETVAKGLEDHDGPVF